MRQVSARIISNQQLVPGVNLIWAEAPEIARATKPGQFAMLRAGEGYDPLLRRPLNIHRLAPQNGAPTQIALLFNVLGRGTAFLANRKEGDALDILGPLGKGFSVQRTAKNLLLVGGGMGVAPLVGLAEAAVKQGRSVTLLLGAQTAALVYPSHLLPAEVELHVATDDGSTGKHGLVTSLVPEFADWADQVFACGPVPMFRSLAQTCRDLMRHKSVQVLMEANMACGFGACLGCSIETRRGRKLVCKDGPRFELRDLF